MNKKQKLATILLLVFASLLTIARFLHSKQIAILNPAGPVAFKEHQLIIFALALSLVVVIPVFTLLFMFTWKYRESNAAANYSPDLDHSRLAETIWWVVPSILIFIISVVTWQSSHSLDPFKSLVTSTPPMRIQVVALDWKWLFIYPDQRIASVNFVQFPVDTPIDFEITADAPMNSFWIPRLGGQIYAMAGMSTHINLMANEIGSYSGSSANISGRGYAGMKFTARSSQQNDFRHWVDSVSQAPNKLDMAAYKKLAEPSENNKVAYYSVGTPGLYGRVIMKYIMPGMQNMGTQ